VGQTATYTASTFTVNSATSITVTAPPGSGQTHVTVTTAGGTSAKVVTFTFSGGPTAAPTNLKATVTGTSVTLTWTNAPGAAGVKYSVNGGKITWLGGSPSPPPTTLPQNGLAPGKYTYNVYDYNSLGTLSAAATITVTVA
jgi:hypothetical protein